jgi:ApaG protein
VPHGKSGVAGRREHGPQDARQNARQDARKKDGPMYQSQTHGVRVTVVPEFMQRESAPAEGRYFWAYTIEIINLSQRTLRLMTRHWLITDGRGEVHEVRGEGVVGQQPVLAPGESFSYTSGCPLTTPDGTMSGHYTMLAEDGTSVLVAVPLFPLDSPYVTKVLH